MVPVDGTIRTARRTRGRHEDTSSLPPCRPFRVPSGTPPQRPLHSSCSVTLLRQCRRILPRRQYRSTGDSEPKEAPHAGDFDPRQDDGSTGPFDFPRGRIEVVHAHVVHAARDFSRLDRPDSSAPATGCFEGEILTEGEFHGLKAPFKNFLQEIPGGRGVGARELGECHRADPAATRNFLEKVDRKSTRLNSSHSSSAYAVVSLKKKRIKSS